jgi:hypothetical protein
VFNVVKKSPGLCFELFFLLNSHVCRPREKVAPESRCSLTLILLRVSDVRTVRGWASGVGFSYLCGTAWPACLRGHVASCDPSIAKLRRPVFAQHYPSAQTHAIERPRLQDWETDGQVAKNSEKQLCQVALTEERFGAKCISYLRMLAAEINLRFSVR